MRPSCVNRRSVLGCANFGQPTLVLLLLLLPLLLLVLLTPVLVCLLLLLLLLSTPMVVCGFVASGMPPQYPQNATGGATPRVLGRQLPLPPPPPPLGAFGQQLVAKGVALRRPWALKAPDAT